MKIPGVGSVGSGISRRGFFAEIQVWVNPPSMIPSVQSQIPALVDGIPIAVVPPVTGVAGPQPSGKCPEDTSGGAYLKTIKENAQRWMGIPGVVSIGSAKCEHDCCDFSKIGVFVQAPFMDSVKAKIPEVVNGVPIEVIPWQWPRAE